MRGVLKDITERKLADLRLRESAESLKEAQAIGGLGSYVIDVATTLWTSSELMDDIFGIDADYRHTLAGWTALLHPDERDGVNRYFAEVVLGQGKNFDREYRIVRQIDHEERWIHGLGRLEFDAQGQPIKVHGIVQDITARKRVELELRESEERYRYTFEQAAVGIVHCSFEGRFLRCNSRFADIVGYSAAELMSMTFQEITPPEDLDESESVLRRVVNGVAGATTWEKRYLRKDGGLTWVKLTVSPQCDAAGRALYSIGLVEDINARKNAELSLSAVQDALQHSEERYRTAFQTSLDAININRLEDGAYIDCNKAFLDVVGFSRDEVIGRNSLELGIWADVQIRQKLVDILRSHGSCRDLEAQFRKKNGELFWGLTSASMIEIEGLACVLSITRDISRAKAAEVEIRTLAFYDSLTGLSNRRLLLELLRQALAVSNRTGRMRALLFLDLDQFKTLNDTLGHQIGDLLLQETAWRLKTCVRDTDTVGRLGGDEFVLMLEDLSELPEEAAAQAKMVGEKIIAVISQPYLLDGHKCSSSASIGISIFGDRPQSPNEVLQQADIAMYQAKASGRGTLRFFAPALQAAVNARAAMEQDLRLGLQAGQFVLYYQPQVDRKRLVGAEALIRWNHPSRKMIPPGEFIPLAEETGLILPLGKWVLEAACEQIAAWANHRQSAQLSIAVNISARQFHQPDFVQQVLAALGRAGANPANLRLELTESILIENVQDVIDKMKQLKSHGLRFSLDDFGTGYSSLAYLNKLPLDQVKIDRSFVRDILTEESSAAIAQTIISLSRAMGLPVIAEGVETEEQRECLDRMGCHAFQGFLFGRPLPLEEFQDAWLSLNFLGTAKGPGLKAK